MTELLTNAPSVQHSLSVPGDKSISHRAIILGSIAEGQSRVKGFLFGEDCIATINVMRQLGVPITIDSDTNEVIVEGRGLTGLQASTQLLDCGNSGTTMRLLSGLLVGQAFKSQLIGDASLNKRPMARVMNPLISMGANIEGYQGSELPPVTIQPVDGLTAIRYEMPVASAQVKSAILLAALQADGETEVIEQVVSRNHTEEMLQLFGVDLKVEGKHIKLNGGQTLKGQTIEVPGDISSAAYFLAAGLLLADTELKIKNVGLNETRSGILEVIQAMGGQLEVQPRANGISADITVRSSRLKATVIEGELIPRLIDELPIIALMATQAEGVTLIKDAAELKVKETDRVVAVAEQLNALGAEVTATADGWEIKGGSQLREAAVKSYGDHRIGMMLQIAALLVKAGRVDLEDAACVNISYPEFFETVQAIWGE